LNADPNIAVRCRGLTKAYGTGASSVVALRGIDLDVHCGELLMVVGPSGCGKTTLISIIGTILNQDGGQCVVLDRDVEKMDEAERALFRGTSIGFVFQLFNLLPTLTALENVLVPLLITGASWDAAAMRARAALEAVGLGARLGATRASSASASNSAWRLPAPWCMTPSSFFAMSRAAASITKPGSA